MEQRGNPFTSATGIVKLHNFFSGASVVDEVARRLLNFDENSMRRYESFRKERFIDKTKMLSETIQKSNLPHFATQSQEEAQKKSQCDKEVAKEVAHIQKLMDIAKSRHIPISEILEYDLLGASPLFEGDFPKKPAKHKLVLELECRAPTSGTFIKDSSENTILLADFASILWRIPTHSIHVFRDLFTSAWLSITSVCRFDQLHIVFDSYLEDSIKGSERSRRNKLDPLDFFGITLDTKFPVQVDRFWASIHNKEQLQILSRIFLKQVAEKEPVNMVLSGYVDHEKNIKDCIEYRFETDWNDIEIFIEKLRSGMEEADIRLILHISYCIQKGFTRIIIISNDTDVVVLVLYYVPLFKRKGLKELWIQYGTGIFNCSHKLTSNISPTSQNRLRNPSYYRYPCF